MEKMESTMEKLWKKGKYGNLTEIYRILRVETNTEAHALEPSF